MERLNRKRQRDQPESSRHDPPERRVKSTSQLTSPAYFGLEYWDSLSKVWLTRRALRELDRRRSVESSAKHTVPEVYISNLLPQFARRGGPDLGHLRVYKAQRKAAAMKPDGPSKAKAGPSNANASPPEATLYPTENSRTSPYDRNFEQHMNDNLIYMDNRKSKLKDTAVPPKNRRASLSPSRFSEAAFERFHDEHRDLGSEGDLMRKIIPIISGNAQIPNSGKVHFTNMEPITGAATVHPVPDYFDGARFDDIDKVVREELGGLILPTKNPKLPVAPNFFLEILGPNGTNGVTANQTGYDGAVGARAMHALKTYGEEEPAYDGVAYTYTCTYDYNRAGAFMSLYAHHVTAPTVPGGRPQYHMTMVGSWNPTANLDMFVQAVTAFRNARDKAKEHRDRFIGQANAKARLSASGQD